MEEILRKYSFKNLKGKKLYFKIGKMVTDVLFFLLLVASWFFLVVYFVKNFTMNEYLLWFLVLTGNIFFIHLISFFYYRKILIYFLVWKYERSIIVNNTFRKEKIYKTIKKISLL